MKFIGEKSGAEGKFSIKTKLSEAMINQMLSK